VNVQLGPSAGPLGKFAQGGRNWEGFGSDPYLQGIMMAQTIEACKKPASRRLPNIGLLTSKS
jgi:beta-glucosidase